MTIKDNGFLATRRLILQGAGATALIGLGNLPFLAPAVPDVVRTTAGCPVCWAIPSAKKPAERSSMWLHTLMPGAFQSARASGALRDPGETHACSMPARESSSAKAEARAVLRLVKSAI